MLSATDFIMNTSNVNAYEKTELTLYFADETGNRLVPEKREVVHNINTSLEQLVVEQLIAGPGQDGHNPTPVSYTHLSGKYDVIIINFANPDMVGHTGVEDAAIKAIETVDACVGRAVEAIREVDGVMFICADHGNAEQLVDYETGEPFTAHTTNPVPFILVNADPSCKLREGGALCDIVPTLIELMGMEQPKEMTGKSLLVK